MKEEQERGRVTAIRNRRLKAIAHAISIAPIFEKAREELGSDPTLRAYADWLNARDHKTRLGKVWRAQSVSDALSVNELIVRQAEEEYLRTIAIEEEIYRRAKNLELDANRAKQRRDDAISRANEALGEARDEAKKILMLMRGTAFR